ncbi:MAG: uracil-DNA glycosylase, partial [bacterium]
MGILIPPTGPCPARVMIVGEAPGADEVKAMTPFVGASGRELDKMLHEAGLIRADCFITNVCPQRPPGNKIDTWLISTKTKGRALHYPERFSLFMSPEIEQGLQQLREEVARCKPNVIIALGNTPLWALTGKLGITDWRGSTLEALEEFGGRTVIPTYHPAAILRMWSWRAIAVNDLKRAE